jgi:hypothetical protein
VFDLRDRSSTVPMFDNDFKTQLEIDFRTGLGFDLPSASGGRLPAALTDTRQGAT